MCIIFRYLPSKTVINKFSEIQSISSEIKNKNQDLDSYSSLQTRQLFYYTIVVIKKNGRVGFLKWARTNFCADSWANLWQIFENDK